MDYVDLVLRWMHILAALTLVGGTLFLRCVWLPSTQGMDSGAREANFSKLRSGWARLVMLSTLFLLVSGLVNAVNIIKRFEIDSQYHILVLVKLILALVLFFFSARVAGRSESAVRFRESIGKWLTVNTVVALLLVLIAGYMKLIPRDAKLPKSSGLSTAESVVDPSAVTR